MTKQLYTMMDELGGMQVPLNAPSGEINNLRNRARSGEKAADFPQMLISDPPVDR
jgi:N-acetylglucosamine-6-sulfatase